LAITLPKVSTGSLAYLCRDVGLLLAAILAFLVPLDPVRNIDFQGLLLIISGSFAWCALLLGYKQTLRPLGRLNGTLLAIFSLWCVISLLVNPHYGDDFFGAPYIRLGTAGLLAVIGIGLLVKALLPAKQLIIYLYGIIMGLAVVSVPYSLWHFHSLTRVGGLFAQADIMGCFAGCGLLLGLQLVSSYRRYRTCLLVGQLFLAVILLLTQTRAVLLAVIVLYIVWEVHNHRATAWKRVALCLTIVAVLLGMLHYLAPNRLTNTTYADQSIRYRLTLQGAALKATRQKPFWGYGPGNLADALRCTRLPAGPLQTTCHQGYFFNSSHNIFIDRVLAIGWPGGIAYLVLVSLAIYNGLRSKREVRIMAYAVLLISCYYLTNVTSLALELLLWVLLMQCLSA
jgi:O-antigen ligase